MFSFWKGIQSRFGMKKISTAHHQDFPSESPENAPQVSYDVVASFLSDVGCHRAINEDNGRYIKPNDPEMLAKKGMLFLVADGMGGHSGGEVASRLAIEVVSRFYYEKNADAQSALENAILEANSAIYLEAARDPNLLGMGTTCTALVLQNGSAISAHIGDSRLYLIRDGEIYLMTEDHSAVMQMVRRGVLSVSQARQHPEKNVILRALGSHPIVEVATWTHPLPVRVGDKFLLCSDGLYDLVEDGEMKTAIIENSPYSACEVLIDLAKSRGGYDNITVGVVSLMARENGESREVKPTRETEVLQ
ncbi:MAG: Stp1/IreP family PP2C-type Ser/Thr phosphatase [Acidobacteriota bacterium]